MEKAKTRQPAANEKERRGKEEKKVRKCSTRKRPFKNVSKSSKVCLVLACFKWEF